jgi:uncharacterized membrane protein
MNWRMFFIKFFRNVVLGVIFSVVVLGVFGYLLGGKDGLVNMAYWGIALGLIGGFFSGIGVMFEAEFWNKNGHYKIFPEWGWFIKKSEDDNKNDY